MNENPLWAETQNYFRLAVPLMAKYNIPITPENYAVWYKYVCGASVELCKSIDALCEENKPFTRETSDALYRQFCAPGDEGELKKLREDLRQILVTILSQVADLTGQTKKYEKFIAGSVDELNKDASIDHVKKVVGALIRETQSIGKFGKTVQNELKETTQTIEALKKELEQVRKEALVDFLTGVPNRKAFDEMLKKSIEDARSENKPLCLLLIDLDHFKKFNDQFGHLIGDEVLRFTTRMIKKMVRGGDYLARFGGEEFAVILPQTAVAGAKVVAENISSFFAQVKMKTVTTAKSIGTITLSIGVSCLRPDESPEQLISRADQALYIAKSTGRNKAVTENELASGHVGMRHIGADTVEMQNIPNEGS